MKKIRKLQRELMRSQDRFLTLQRKPWTFQIMAEQQRIRARQKAISQELEELGIEVLA
jgi:hypothetical protein